MAYKLLVRFSSFHFAQPGVRLKGNYLKPKFSSPVRSVSSVKVEDATNRLVIRWKDNISDAFPHMWLRDNCQCSSCYNSSTQSRTINMQDFQMNHTPKSAKLRDDQIEVVWEDDHKSLYHLKWLKERSFRKEAQSSWLELMDPPYQTWNSQTYKNSPVLNFNDVMLDDKTCLQWLLQLKTLGICLLENVPNALGQAKRIIERVAFIKRTHYGEEFSVAVKVDAANPAYTPQPLQFHTDLPYYEYMPGLNFLHSLIPYSGNGGDNIFADGFRIAEWLKEHDPSTFKILSETNITWSDIGRESDNDFHKIFNSPVISANESGNIKRINFSQPQRDSHMTVPIDQVEAWYRAVKTFHNLAHAPDNFVQFKLQRGHMITLDNRRILHGRTGFAEGGERLVEAGYLDWDEANSRIRVLRSKLEGSTS